MEAATKIQAGFRGVQTRKNLKNTKPPTIIVQKDWDTEYSEYESETNSSFYEDEDEESESLEERPISPKTMNFQQWLF